MKKIVIALTTILFLAAACKKSEISESLSTSVENNASATPDFSKCKIRRIYQSDLSVYFTTALFTYNKAGNPYSVIYADGGTGVNDHHFFYDSKNRLIRYQQDWVGYITENHFYSYNSAGTRIIKDSLVRFDCCGNMSEINVSSIEYDSQGRVIKETIVNKYQGEDQPLNPIRRPTYTYDARGNLAVAGWKSSSYDNKINPLRQNPIFQFIHRNYSMNNAASQAKYNLIGLPLSMNPTNDYFFNNEATQKIIYDCQ